MEDIKLVKDFLRQWEWYEDTNKIHEKESLTEVGKEHLRWYTRIGRKLSDVLRKEGWNAP